MSAVKCNNDPAILATLVQLGIGFDCASQKEIAALLNLNVNPDRIVYANTCKQRSHLRYAAAHGVRLMTFDNEAELHKIKSVFPSAKLLLRIAVRNFSAEYPMGNKFGCSLGDITDLLTVAKNLQLEVTGVSFHVGCLSHEKTAFQAAISDARYVFDIAKENGFDLNLLDIGGGYVGRISDYPLFKDTAAVIRECLSKHFPEESGVRLIAEPGRFFVSPSFMLTTNVIAKRILQKGEEVEFMYHVNEGLYGAFSCLLHGQEIFQPIIMSKKKDSPRYKSTVWGQTCDGGDYIIKDFQMPEVDIGDWLSFEEMGAYTLTCATNFNDMGTPRVYYMIQNKDWEELVGKARYTMDGK